MEQSNDAAKGVQEPVFHMCDAKEFATMTANEGFYYSPTFAIDKFIHATADPKFLLEAGNHFYKVFYVFLLNPSEKNRTVFCFCVLMLYTFVLKCIQTGCVSYW